MYVEIGLLSNAALTGIMISFLVVTSPAVFKTLDKENSQAFLRYLFPRLFIVCALTSILTSYLFFLGTYSFGIVASLVIGLLFLVNNFVLTPRINLMRDLSLSGNEVAKKKFKYLHLTSVLLYFFNLVISLAIIFVYYFS